MADERVTAEKITIKLADGNDYLIKPLSLKATKDLLPLVKELDDLRNKVGMTPELIDKMAEICFKILSPANLELTKEKVLDLVEVGAVYELIILAMGRTK